MPHVFPQPCRGMDGCASSQFPLVFQGITHPNLHCGTESVHGIIPSSDRSLKIQKESLRLSQKLKLTDLCTSTFLLSTATVFLTSQYMLKFHLTMTERGNWFLRPDRQFEPAWNPTLPFIPRVWPWLVYSVLKSLWPHLQMRKMHKACGNQMRKMRKKVLQTKNVLEL